MSIALAGSVRNETGPGDRTTFSAAAKLQLLFPVLGLLAASRRSEQQLFYFISGHFGSFLLKKSN
jgi:hypothetical protein